MNRREALKVAGAGVMLTIAGFIGCNSVLPEPKPAPDLGEPRDEDVMVGYLIFGPDGEIIERGKCANVDECGAIIWDCKVYYYHQKGIETTHRAYYIKRRGVVS